MSTRVRRSWFARHEKTAPRALVQLGHERQPRWMRDGMVLPDAWSKAIHIEGSRPQETPKITCSRRRPVQCKLQGQTPSCLSHHLARTMTTRSAAQGPSPAALCSEWQVWKLPKPCPGPSGRVSSSLGAIQAILAQLLRQIRPRACQSPARHRLEPPPGQTACAAAVERWGCLGPSDGHSPKYVAMALLVAVDVVVFRPVCLAEPTWTTLAGCPSRGQRGTAAYECSLWHPKVSSTAA